MRYVFGEYALDTQIQELRHAGQPVALRPKAFQLLAYLVRHHNRMVSKSELLEQLWPGQFIGDATLNSCLKDLRHAVGDRGETQQVVQTLRGRGYRFVAPLEMPTEPLPETLPATLRPRQQGASPCSRSPLPFRPPHPLALDCAARLVTRCRC